MTMPPTAAACSTAAAVGHERNLNPLLPDLARDEERDGPYGPVLSADHPPTFVRGPLKFCASAHEFFRLWPELPPYPRHKCLDRRCLLTRCPPAFHHCRVSEVRSDASLRRARDLDPGIDRLPERADVSGNDLVRLHPRIEIAKHVLDPDARGKVYAL